MSTPDQAKVRNRLLRALSPGDYALLQPHLVHGRLAKSERLVEPDRPISHVWFLESGLSSFVATAPGGETAEVGLFGFDGLAGIPVVLGADRSPHELFMEIGGDGYKIPADALRSAMRLSHTLHLLLLRYVQAFLVMSAQTTVSNAHHCVDVRLGRWLLMAHDRLEGDDIALTHEYLALMLGVRHDLAACAGGQRLHPDYARQHLHARPRRARGVCRGCLRPGGGRIHPPDRPSS